MIVYSQHFIRSMKYNLMCVPYNIQPAPEENIQEDLLTFISFYNISPRLLIGTNGSLHCVYKIETRALYSVVVMDLLIIYSGIVLTSAAAEVIHTRPIFLQGHLAHQPLCLYSGLRIYTHTLIILLD